MVSLIKLFVPNGLYAVLLNGHKLGYASGQTACKMVAYGSLASFQRVS